LQRLVTAEQVSRERDVPLADVGFRPRQEVVRG